MALPVYSQLEARPLRLPKLRSGEQCPVSRGSHEIVPYVSYIFCAECLWFGSSPVNFAWPYQLNGGNDAFFKLKGVPRYHSAYSAKTPWVARYDFSGPILIRGRQIDGHGKLRFSASGPRSQASLKFVAPNGAAKGQWAFWPADMTIAHGGCYAIQIDTSTGSEIVVFKADDQN